MIFQKSRVIVITYQTEARSLEIYKLILRLAKVPSIADKVIQLTTHVVLKGA